MSNKTLRKCFVLATAVLLAGGASAQSNAGPSSSSEAARPERTNRIADTIPTSKGELRLMPLFHGSVMLEFGGKVIHVDPWSRADYSGLPQADLIVITHTHADHLDRPLVEKLKKPGTIIVGSPAVIDTLNCFPGCGEEEPVNDSQKKTVMGIEIEGVPMYNINLGPSPGQPFHHKGVGSGYVLGFGNTRVYFSGDTSCTPEMKQLKNITVAFIAMSASRSQSPLQAAECVRAFQPKIVYPYHYRGSDPAEFARAIKDVPGIEVRIRKLEGEP